MTGGTVKAMSAVLGAAFTASVRSGDRGKVYEGMRLYVDGANENVGGMKDPIVGPVVCGSQGGMTNFAVSCTGSAHVSHIARQDGYRSLTEGGMRMADQLKDG
ncbi:uncharacterized protein UDID_19656 [Ustilago sp. UG-2017a]|nr:uncharacterized protein UDID_19656 [Ustilago sp. UG-2017a]